MSDIPNKSDYVRYALYSAGFTPTDEIVNEIYATTFPRLMVDSLILAMQVNPPARAAMDFMKSMQALINDAGYSQEQIGEVSEAIRKMAE